jgi:hypothetical protein
VAKVARAATGVSSVLFLSFIRFESGSRRTSYQNIFLYTLQSASHLSFVNDSLPHSIVEERALQKKNGIRRVSNTHHHHYYSEHGGHYSVRYYSEYGSSRYYRIVCKEEVTSEPTENPAPMPIPVSLPCPDSIQQRMNINLLTFSSHPFAISPSPLYHPCLLPLPRARVASSTCARSTPTLTISEVW